jgi:HK97 family phage major capsid protein
VNILEIQARRREWAKRGSEFKAKGWGGISMSDIEAFNREGEELDAAEKAYGDALRYSGCGGADGGNPAPSVVDSGKRLHFGSEVSSALATKALTDSGIGMKALAPNGSVVVAQTFRPDPVALGKPALSLLDVLPVIPHDTAEYAYLRQNVRTNAAAVVPEGQLKPISVYSVERIESKLAVVAHLSEAIPRHWILDNSSLQAFVNSELQYGLQTKIEQLVLTAITTVAGTQPNPYATSVVVTLRKSLTLLELSGYDPAWFALSPTDWEAVEIALGSVNATEYQGIPYDAARRTLWGVPVVVVPNHADGTGVTAARDSVALDVGLEGVELLWTEAGSELFDKNLTKARCETRTGNSIFAPAGLVISDLSAGVTRAKK